mmetsp:Transcript_9387/g.23365  ORF Transcript_9387/g.23365 Transcript_9387/m.23365 type:complete len:201 (+) Transcript_9387:5022-5624(+)
MRRRDGQVRQDQILWRVANWAHAHPLDVRLPDPSENCECLVGRHDAFPVLPCGLLIAAFREGDIHDSAIDKEAGLQVAATAAELGISFVLLGIWAIDVQVLVTLRVGNRSTSLLGTATQHHSLQLLLRAMEFHRIDHLVVSGISQKSGAIVANTSQHIVRGLHEAPMEHGPCERQVAPMPGAALDVLSARLTNRADVNRA